MKNNLFSIQIKDRPLGAVRTKETMLAWVLESLGLARNKGDLGLMERLMSGQEITCHSAREELGMSRTGFYDKINRLQRARVVYRKTGGYYVLRNRRLSEVLDLRIRKDIDTTLSQIIANARELEKMMEAERHG